MFLNIKVDDQDFTLAKEGLAVELDLNIDNDGASNFLENECSKLITSLIHKTYAYCAHCNKVFVKLNHNQKFCSTCKKCK